MRVQQVARDLGTGAIRALLRRNSLLETMLQVERFLFCS
jgi:hypothetical protein